MNLLTRLGGSAAAALLLAGSAQAPADEIDDLAGQIAGRSAAVRLVLDRLSAPETARLVVESAVRGDARAFNQLFEGIELEVPNKCFYISELIETMSSSQVWVQECSIRDNLTWAEWNNYFAIAKRHDQLGGRGNNTALLVETDASGGAVVTPGAFLDELKANGLVTCQFVKKYVSGSSLVFGKPQRFCFQQPPRP